MQTNHYNNNNVGNNHACSGAASCLKRVAYFNMDSQASEPLRLLQVDGRLCSHVILAFARIDSNGSVCIINKDHERHLRDVREFKRRNPAVRVLISMCNNHNSTYDKSASSSGSSSPPSTVLNNNNDQPPPPAPGELAPAGFLGLINSAQNRQRFVRSSMDFLHKFHLDGVDLDWEFPNFPHTFNSREHERLGLSKIVKDLRSTIVENFFNRQVTEQHHQSHDHSSIYNVDQQATSVEPYLLTVAIGAQEAILRSSYELKLLANLCDWFNVMSYDYYLFKPYAPFTGPNSPLYPIMDPFVPFLGKLSFTSTINKLLSEGIEADKIVMGVPTYARAYRLLFRSQNPAPFTIAYASKGGQDSGASANAGAHDCWLSYREVCDILAQKETKVAFDERARVPYLLTDDGYTWVSYEDERSVGEKLHCILEHQLAGYMTWNLNCDYLANDRFPLHEALLKHLNSSSQQKQQATTKNSIDS